MSYYKEVSNEAGLSVTIISSRELTAEDKPNSFLGGDSSNPTWDEYLEDYKDEYKPHILLIKKSIEENHMIGYTGQDADDVYFKFSDGHIWGFTWRAWGDLMQSIVNKKEGYMAYYM